MPHPLLEDPALVSQALNHYRVELAALLTQGATVTLPYYPSKVDYDYLTSAIPDPPPFDTYALLLSCCWAYVKERHPEAFPRLRVARCSYLGFLSWAEGQRSSVSWMDSVKGPLNDSPHNRRWYVQLHLCGIVYPRKPEPEVLGGLMPLLFVFLLVFASLTVKSCMGL